MSKAILLIDIPSSFKFKDVKIKYEFFDKDNKPIYSNYGVNELKRMPRKRKLGLYNPLRPAPRKIKFSNAYNPYTYHSFKIVNKHEDVDGFIKGMIKYDVELLLAMGYNECVEDILNGDVSWKHFYEVPFRDIEAINEYVSEVLEDECE